MSAQAMTRWRVMSDPPAAPTMAIGWSATVASAMAWPEDVTSPARDERLSLIFWDGGDWCWLGTGHEIFEDGDDPRHPTHWTPAPQPPEDQP